MRPPACGGLEKLDPCRYKRLYGASSELNLFDRSSDLHLKAIYPYRNPELKHLLPIEVNLMRSIPSAFFARFSTDKCSFEKNHLMGCSPL